jgi:twitching motility two-component system response regulator PilH
MFLTDMLVKNGFSVKTAENRGRLPQARRTSQSDSDVVMLPGQNGFQLTRAITRDHFTSDLPIIVFQQESGD